MSHFFDDGNAHETARKLAGYITAMLRGQAAQNHLNDGPAGPWLILPPVWTFARADVGRKSRPCGGGPPMVMPWRLHGPLLLLSDTADHQIDLEVASFGVRDHLTLTTAGHASRPLSEAGVRGAVDEGTWLPEHPDDLPRRLAELVEAGAWARWELASYVESQVRLEVRRSAYTLRAAVSPMSADIDAHSLDALSDRTALGGERRRGTANLVCERVLSDPHLFDRVEPTRWIATVARRDASQSVRRYYRATASGAGLGALSRSSSLEDLREWRSS